ncbi:hypothetical protein O6H91_06G051700 [Diphasiastrum complanatum]|uniref:Uncharacterized protein n=1 Tax=Diphasiastrum complanatum TaxID=34168 RepID=A0ACC2DDQ2_DIPCM|nr:hypothetical protein O6H91_06G051700 [Diphasiastrum complanatum]
MAFSGSCGNSSAVLSPSRPTPSSILFHHHFSAIVYLIRHAESTMNSRPDLIGGRSPTATLTSNGLRQAITLGASLRSSGVQFDAIYTSPLERAKQTALLVCKEMEISEHLITCSEALQEQSQGLWEGRSRAEIYSPEMIRKINSLQPDFAAPEGESQRQVECRMLEFLATVVSLNPVSAPRQFACDAKHASNTDRQACGTFEAESTGADEVFPDLSQTLTENRLLKPNLAIRNQHQFCAGIFLHGMAIKCLLRGILGSNPILTHTTKIDNTSVTILTYSTQTRWQVEKINDTSHLAVLG